MEENTTVQNEIKKVGKKIGKIVGKALIKMSIPLLVVLLIIVLLAGIAYVVLEWTMERREDYSSTPYAVETYTNELSVGSDGNITSDMTAEELWQKMVDAGSPIKQYLNGPEELAKLMQAQIITQLPDTREDVTAEIDWDKVLEDPNSFQGIIKFLRKDSDGSSEKYLTYMDYDEFMQKVNSGDTDVFNYFTLKKTATSTTSGTSSYSNIKTTGRQADISAQIVNALVSAYENNKLYGLGAGWCQAWIQNVYNDAGLGAVPSGCCAYLAGQKWGVSSDFTQIVNGAAVWTGEGSYKYTQCSTHTNGGCGHAGIYYKDENEDDWVISLTSAGIVKQSLQSWLDDFGEGNSPVWGWQGGVSATIIDEGTATSSSNSTTNSKNNSSSNDTKTINEEKSSVSSSYTGELVEVGDGDVSYTYTTKAGNTYKNYLQAGSSWGTTSYWGGPMSNWACGPTTISILASGLIDSSITPRQVADEMSYTSYETLSQEMQKLGMQDVQVDQSPSEEKIINALNAGKVLAISCTPPFATSSSHILALVDYDPTTNKVMILNPAGNYSGGTGWKDISTVVGCMQYFISVKETERRTNSKFYEIRKFYLSSSGCNLE